MYKFIPNSEYKQKIAVKKLGASRRKITQKVRFFLPDFKLETDHKFRLKQRTSNECRSQGPLHKSTDDFTNKAIYPTKHRYRKTSAQIRPDSIFTANTANERAIGLHQCRKKNREETKFTKDTISLRIKLKYCSKKH